MNDTTAPPSLRRKLVYIVEDDEEQLYVLRMMLSDAGCDVVTETDADKVIKSATELKPDVILLDVMLPSQSGTDGFNLCRQIRDLPELSATRIIIVSAIAQGIGGQREKMMEQVGADEFLIKPYDPPELLRLIAELAP